MSVPAWLLEALAAAGVPLVPACSSGNGTGKSAEKRHVPVVPPEPPPDTDAASSLEEAMAERAAIMEFDGGLPRDVADRLAMELIMSRQRRTLH